MQVPIALNEVHLQCAFSPVGSTQNPISKLSSTGQISKNGQLIEWQEFSVERYQEIIMEAGERRQV